MAFNEGEVRKLKVAAIQTASKLGHSEINLQHTMPLIKQAKMEGAQLIVFPEMNTSGYTLTKDVWDIAEPVGGPTEQWLKNTSKTMGVYLGIGLVEAEGEDFFNTFLISSPEGEILGRVRKTQVEYIIFKAGDMKSHIVNTPIGRIGVGICADNHKVFLAEFMQEEEVDLLLMPHAWPVPFKTSRIISQQDIIDTQEKQNNYPKLYAKMLGVPVIFVNHVGPIEGGKWLGIIGRLMNSEYFRYGESSTIIDSNMDVLAQLEQKEGIIVADITLNSSKKIKGEIKSYGGWIDEGNPLMRKVILPFEIARGKLSYFLSSKRERKALAISSLHTQKTMNK